ncbi:MAG: hypothetical protein NUV92_11335 [Ignavibacteria bacterium]|jgi:Tol biopolymer transport system component|nr:hypothetical protein [Ignavibacteria bacterium]MDH7528409.1 hypothetical protein [Ignavibacteria bacterium]
MLSKKLCQKLIEVLSLVLIFAASVEAQFTYFGRNKVQYDTFNWQVIKTEHFDIYYYPEFTEIAEIGARYAEESYENLKVKFNHIVLQRIPLIFYNTHLHFEQTNTTPGLLPEGVGGFFEFMKGRVVLPFDGSLRQFKHVIKHELVHVFMTNKVRRIQTDFRITSDLLPPLWFVEGLAEFWSTEWDDQAEMILRDAVLNGYIVGLKDIDRISGTFLMYKVGQKILEFVAEKYGEDKILLLLDNFWKSNNFEDIWKVTLGVDYSEFDKEWKYYLQKKYLPVVGENDLPGYASNKITDFGFNFSPVYFKDKNDEYLIFLANRDGYSSIYRLKLEGKGFSKPELIIQGEKSDEFESFHLFRSSIDVSKNGVIVFSSKSKGRDRLNFYTLKENKISISKSFEHILSISNPKFSKDGNRVVFSGIDLKGYRDLYVYEIDRDNLIRLTNDYYDDRNPSFYIDNNYVVFSSDRTSKDGKYFYNLFLLRISDLRIFKVTSLDFDQTYPVFSEDGSKLFFTSNIDKVSNIWMINVIKKDDELYFEDKMQKVTSFTSNVYDPVIVDSSIYFCAFENFSFQIYKINDAYEEIKKINQSKNKSADSLRLNWVAKGIDGIKVRERIKYEREYNLDFAQSHITTNPVYGTSGGALFSISDLLSDDHYQFLIFNTAQSRDEFLKSFNVAISKISLSQKVNYAFGVFHFSGRRYDIRDSDEYFYERSFGAYFALSYPFSFFRRLEASISLANSDKEVFFTTKSRKALLLTNSISYVFDNSLWASSGPIDGSRFMILLGQTNDIKFSNVNYYSFMLDYRYYLRLGLKSAFATRFQFFFNEGREARRFFMGGNWDLRGYPRWSIRGEKLWLTSFELRFPLVNQITIKFPFLTMNLFEFRGAAFFDMGNAWDIKYNQTLGSVGFGVRMNLFGVLVLRYDIGKRIEDGFRRFQDRLFYQFFFGWDF